MFWFKKSQEKDLHPRDEAKKEPPRFMARLKKDIGPVVWAVSEEDHFIRVYGEKSEDRILYRFSDAVHDLRFFEGTKVDLDHWVLKEAIERVEPVAETFEIVLKNGKRFSVSESYRRILQESQWEKK